MFYEKYASPIAVQQDLIFEVAYHVTNGEIKVDFKYYQSKKWYSDQKGLFKQTHEKAKELTNTDELSLQEAEPVSEDIKYESKFP